MTSVDPPDPIEPYLRDEEPPAEAVIPAALLVVFGPPEDNPFKHRRR